MGSELQQGATVQGKPIIVRVSAGMVATEERRVTGRGGLTKTLPLPPTQLEFRVYSHAPRVPEKDAALSHALLKSKGRRQETEMK